MEEKRLVNTLKPQEVNKVEKISGMLDMGWWEADLIEQTFTGSSLICQLLGIQSSIKIDAMNKLIREDYRSRVVQTINSASHEQTRQLNFPVYSGNSIKWVSTRFRKNQDNRIVSGILFHIDRPKGEKNEEVVHETVRNLIHQLNGISKSLFAFLQSENLDDMVNHILASLVKQYSAERAYIFEYYWDELKQSCIYEAVSREGLEEIQNLQMIFFEPDTWWNKQILAQQPIILHSLDDLPEWDVVDRDVLEAQNIKSLMVVPFISQDNRIWGYAGIDVVDKQRTWTEEDFQWFSSLMHIINICFELGKSKTRIQNDEVEMQKMIMAKEKAEALDRLKSTFLANMSHEIRTPLNSIIGFTDLLVETSDEEERKEYISIIQRNNELLLKLVSDILDLSKIESGTFDFTKQEVRVKPLCEEIISSFRNKEISENVELIFDNDQPDETILADANRVKQVLMNFITNATKFTEKGYIKLGYELNRKDQILFYVEDTGIGISRDDLTRIFNRFVKLNSFAQGSGLGLSISKSLIEQMGGTIGAQSKVGKGSRFWFTLPKE